MEYRVSRVLWPFSVWLSYLLPARFRARRLRLMNETGLAVLGFVSESICGRIGHLGSMTVAITPQNIEAWCTDEQLKRLGTDREVPIPRERWTSLVSWVMQHPERCKRIIRDYSLGRIFHESVEYCNGQVVFRVVETEDTIPPPLTFERVWISRSDANSMP